MRTISLQTMATQHRIRGRQRGAELVEMAFVLSSGHLELPDAVVPVAQKYMRCQLFTVGIVLREFFPPCAVPSHLT